MIVIEDRYADERKSRKITLHKEPMCQEVDSHTSKFVDAAHGGNPRQDNAISSDSHENLDGSVIARLMEYRDAKLRHFLSNWLQQVEILSVDNDFDLNADFIYNLELPVEFNDANLKGLAILMHKYIVWGCLFDWYGQLGSAEANIYGRTLDEIESDIESLICSEGYEVRPLQPFGPAL